MNSVLRCSGKKKRMFLVALVLQFCELLGMLAWIVRHRLS